MFLWLSVDIFLENFTKYFFRFSKKFPKKDQVPLTKIFIFFYTLLKKSKKFRLECNSITEKIFYKKKLRRLVILHGYLTQVGFIVLRHDCTAVTCIVGLMRTCSVQMWCFVCTPKHLHQVEMWCQDFFPCHQRCVLRHLEPESS